MSLQSYIAVRLALHSEKTYELIMPPKRSHKTRPAREQMEEKGISDPDDPNFHCTCNLADCGDEDKCKCTAFEVKCRPICNCAKPDGKVKCKNA